MEINTSDWTALSSFYRQHLRPNHPLTNKALFDWCFGPRQFFGESIGLTPGYSVLIARKDNQIVGHIGAIRVPMRVHDRAIRAAWYVNIFVPPEFRGHGIASTLLLRGLERYDLVMGLGTSEEGLRLYQRHGYTRLGYLNRYLRILDSERAALLLDSKVENYQGLENHLQQAADRTPEPHTNLLGVAVHETFAIPTGYERLWDRFAQRFTATIDRIPDYLSWRFGAHPDFRYSLIVANRRDSSLCGVLIFRVDSSTHSVSPVVRVTDVIADDDAVHALLLALEEKGRESGAAMIEYFCSSDRFKAHFDRAGYVTGPDELTTAVCRLYHPLRSASPPAVPFSLKSSLPIEGEELKAPAEWYVTLSDSDLDRVQR